MARRRDIPPPIEVLGSSPPPLSGGAAGRGDGERGVLSRGGRSWSWTGLWDTLKRGRWVAQASQPMVVRLPRGYAAAIVAAMLGLLVLAYWVGRSRGAAAANAEWQQSLEVTRERFGGPRLVGGGGGPAAVNSGAAGDPGSQPLTSGNPQDPRLVGLNYLIIARYDITTAERLIEFLAQQGVETFGVPADREGVYFVIARRGFPPGSVGSEGEAFKDQVRRLGRAWKQHNSGRSDDLPHMYFKKYEP